MLNKCSRDHFSLFYQAGESVPDRSLTGTFQMPKKLCKTISVAAPFQAELFE